MAHRIGYDTAFTGPRGLLARHVARRDPAPKVRVFQMAADRVRRGLIRQRVTDEDGVGHGVSRPRDPRGSTMIAEQALLDERRARSSTQV
jgi:hypothetical protein